MMTPSTFIRRKPDVVSSPSTPPSENISVNREELKRCATAFGKRRFDPEFDRALNTLNDWLSNKPVEESR